MTTPMACAAPASVPARRCVLAWVLTAAATVALRSWRFDRVERLARWLVPPARHPAGAAEIEVMLAAIDRAGRWLPARVACLERSLVVVLWCGLRRRSVCWRIGVRTPPLTVHSWIEAAGQPVGELVPIHSYLPILTIGQPDQEQL
ncbi:MAG: lasso peptide biosynthesis B2 protein [Pseudonocardiaceae bacterium]